jgi:S-DNA-T family DNA segregation ATPase FtsK/SpoIIIE
MEGPNSGVFPQAENRLHVQKAVLYELLVAGARGAKRAPAKKRTAAKAPAKMASARRAAPRRAAPARKPAGGSRGAAARRRTRR